MVPIPIRDYCMKGEFPLNMSGLVPALYRHFEKEHILLLFRWLEYKALPVIKINDLQEKYVCYTYPGLYKACTQFYFSQQKMIASASVYLLPLKDKQFSRF